MDKLFQIQNISVSAMGEYHLTSFWTEAIMVVAVEGTSPQLELSESVEKAGLLIFWRKLSETLTWKPIKSEPGSIFFFLFFSPNDLFLKI